VLKLESCTKIKQSSELHLSVNQSKRKSFGGFLWKEKKNLFDFWPQTKNDFNVHFKRSLPSLK